MRRRTIIAEYLFDIIAVSRKHPVWSAKLIAATAIILDEISPRRVLLFRILREQRTNAVVNLLHKV